MKHDRPRIQRLLLRRVLRKQYAQADNFQRDLIQIALRDDAIFEPLYEQSMRSAQEFGAATGRLSVVAASDGSLLVDNLLKLLQWFVTNGPDLVKVIELIVGLFGGAATATAVWADERLQLFDASSK